MKVRLGNSLLVLLLAVTAAAALPLEGPARIDALLQVLEEASDFKVRLAAAEQLGRFADGSVADWMLRAFRRERNPAVRLAVLYAVGQIPDARIIPPLLELANEEILHEPELLAVERVLWNARRTVDVPAWEAFARTSSDRKERATAVWLLGIVAGPTVLPTLLRASEHPSSFVRMRALSGISRLGRMEGRAACERATREDPDRDVRRVALGCTVALDLLARGPLPPDRDHRVDLKTDWTGLETASVTPETFRAYLRKNANPRLLEVASESLQEPNRAEERTDRTVTLIRDERIRETVRLDAVLVTPHRFRPADLGRLRETVRSEAGSVNGCYLEALSRNRKLGGTVSVRFLVLATGEVSSVELAGGTLPDPGVKDCIRTRIRGIRFPSVPVPSVTMNYTFTFLPPEDQKIIFGSAR